MTRNERQLKAVEQEMERFSLEAQAIWKKADEEERDTTMEERGEVEEKLKAIDTLKSRKDELEQAIAVEREVIQIGNRIGAEDGKSEQQQQQRREPVRAKSFGQQFVEADGYKRVKEKGFAGSWKTGLIDLETKATLLEGDNPLLEGGTPGTGGWLVPLDQRPGVQPILFQRLTVADLFASGQTSSNAINYVQETLADNNAAVVPEGGSKPESALEFDNVQEAVKKIATFLPVSDEMLEDAQAIRAYIDARLSLFVRIKEEEELLHGAGGSNFRGLEPRIPVANRFVQSDATQPNAADHIYAAITVARQSYLEPDGIVIHPDDWADLRLLKDSTYNYIAGSPFSTGGGEPGETLWNKRVVVTEACIPGQAVVGAFATGAQVFRRGGLSVEASNSHSDYFVKNLTAIRAEQREALAVYRPEAFAIADLGYAS